MNEHRFVLQPYRGVNSRFRCPQCQHHNKTFKRYIDLETYGYLAGHVGRCDREEKCGYHYTPRQFFAENPGNVRPSNASVCKAAPIKPQFNHLNIWLVQDSMIQKAYIHNHFILPAYCAACQAGKTPGRAVAKWTALLRANQVKRSRCHHELLPGGPES